MASLVPDITEKLPALVSARTASAEATARGVLYDVVIGGIGFVFAIDPQNPYLRETVPVQKEQFDTSTEPGEQTLEGFWTRSQTSWHLGAGADYYEPGSRDETLPSQFRFKDSRGVDPWTPGRLTLHRAVDEVEAVASDVAVCGARSSSGEDIWFSAQGTTIDRHDSGGATQIATDAGLAASYGLVLAGSVLLTGGTTGVYSTKISDGTVTHLCTQAAGTACTPYWAKGRIITTKGAEVHEHTLAGGAIDSASAIFTHPDSGWGWTGVAETPDAILAAGRSGGQSAIYAFVLTEDTGGSVPKLGQPFQVAELPPGEEIRSIRCYLGRYLGIGTSAGVRVGIVGEGGQVQYGPLLVTTDEPVRALGARDSFLYAAAGHRVIRVNLAEAIDNGLRFPYAYDVELPDDSATITSLAFDGVSDRPVFGANGTGTFAASETDYVTSGWLESGDIRYSTTAPKAFRAIDLVTRTPTGTSVAVSAVVDDTIDPLVTLADGKSGLGISLSRLPSPLSQMSYRVTLNGATDTPVVDAVTVKAVPVPRRQRLVQYPVHVADRMSDAKKVPFGRDGYATELLESLEALENARTVIAVNDRTRPEQFEATIEKVEFARVEPRSRSGQKNFGGVAKVTVRTL